MKNKPAPARAASETPTRNTIPAAARRKVAAILVPRLHDSIHLATQLKHAHWNVTGPTFISLHELFDELVDQAYEWSDLLAERIRQLGFPVSGDARVVAENSSLPSYPADAAGAEGHVAAVSALLAEFGTGMRRAIDSCSRAGDQGSADICTEISRAVDKGLWFVESHAN
jgi:starvation-inducible DNA-binding protein